ncbi:MAG: AMP-binding protein [Gemmatimonadetes bacterium]|nr:AMP-binding protein [Gemmatimonadota bacterium]
MNPNLAARLAERAERIPGRLAIAEARGGRTQRINFAELAARVARTGEGLRRIGIGKGNRVLLFVPMSIDLYVALLGVLHAGGTAVFLDAWADRHRLDAAVAAARPSLFIGAPRAHLLRLLSGAVRGIPRHWVAGRRFLTLSRFERTPAAAAAGVAGDDAALVTFTTGSTGKPKAAARSHDFLWAQHEALAEHLELTAGDVDMPTLPVFVLNNLALGVPSVIPDFDPRRPAEFDPERVLRQVEAEGVTTTSGSPAFYDRLARHAEERARPLPFRGLWTGGAPVFPPLAERLASGVAGEAHVVYGSTEAEPIAGIAAGELVERTRKGRGHAGLCAGHPVPRIRLRVIRAHDGPVKLEAAGWEPWELPRAEVGEIVVTGPHVLGEYFDAPEETRRHKIRDGDTVWHRTGDAGRLDEDGRLWLMGRVGARVRRSGEVWWSTPAEVLALTVPGVRHAAYLGLPDDQVGQRAVLCVEADAAAADLDTQLRAALHPIPLDEVLRMKRIPRDPRHASKTDAEALRALLNRPGV